MGNRRRTKMMGNVVVGKLREMAGPRARCMYCSDSRGASIEHFHPKSAYPGRAFCWSNLLWICGDCNSHKNARFPIGALGEALVIDPTADDPWEHLFFDSMTGEVTARYLPDGRQDNRGASTVHTINPLSDQAVTEGRLRVTRNLRRIIARALADESVSAATLAEEIQDADDYGLARWFLHFDGQHEHPFSRLRDEQPSAWAQLAAAAD